MAGATVQRVRIEYQPHRGQQAFHEARYAVRNRAALAGTGGGKTYAGLFEDILWALENPRSVVGVWEPTFPMVKKVLFPTIRKLLGQPIATHPLTADWHRGDLHWELINDRHVWVGGLDDPERAEGPNLDFGHIDEARLVRKLGGDDGALEVIKRRLRGQHRESRTGMIVTTSAPTKVLYDTFENPATRWPQTGVYHWSSLDNPHLPRVYHEIIAGYTGKARERFVEGKYARPEGVVYETFDPVRHVRAPPDRSIVTHATGGVDWGWTHPAVLGVVLWSGNSVAHVAEESYGSHRKVSELVQEAIRLQKRWAPLLGVKWWCGADRPDHIREFQEAGLEAEAYKGRVADGIGIVQDMFAGDELTISPECRNLLRQVEEEYHWKPGDNRKEEPMDQDNDAADMMRYGVCGEPMDTAEALVPSWRK